MMLTDKFWKLAEDTKKIWAQDEAQDEWKHNWLTPTVHLVGTETHCGTSEIANLENGTAKDLVIYIANRIWRDKEGHFLYFCPKTPVYKRAVKKFALLGAQNIYSFYHIRYLTRKPDCGVCDLWMLGVLPKEVTRLELIKETANVEIHQQKPPNSEGAMSEVSFE